MLKKQKIIIIIILIKNNKDNNKMTKYISLINLIHYLIISFLIEFI